MLGTKITKCKLCGCPVRVVTRADGAADHYEALDPESLKDMPVSVPAALDLWLQGGRRGKRTVAIVGSAWSTRAWAPYNHPEVELWCLNEMHGYPDVTRATRWFQLHPRWDFGKNHRTRHWEWLQEEHRIPIYMQRCYDDIPNATVYPLRAVLDSLVTKSWKGEGKLEKVFGSTPAYALALALYEGTFDRVELFGIEMALEGEYAHQRESMAFWLGMAEGRGVETWMPEQCQMFDMPLYAYEETRNGQGEIILPPENAE